MVGPAPWPYWSPDRKYVYAQDPESADQSVFRVRIRDCKLKGVATMQHFTRPDVKTFSLTGLTPGGSLLVSIRRGQDEICAVDVCPRPHGQTGLHWAAQGGHVDAVRELLRRRAPVDVDFAGACRGKIVR